MGINELTAIAYRDGHGKVALGISSGKNQVRSNHWDFHLKCPLDRHEILDQDSNWSSSMSTWIRNLDGDELSLLFLELFVDHDIRVKALTTEGSKDQAWFLARSFSSTSSTTDGVINKVLELAVKQEGLVDNAFRSNLNVILTYIGKPLLPLLIV